MFTSWKLVLLCGGQLLTLFRKEYNMQKTRASDTSKRIAQLIRTFVPFVALISSAALAVDPAYYVKKDTWQETMLASREALMQQARAMGGVPLPDLGRSDFTIMAWIKTTSETGAIVAKAPAKAGWQPQGKVFFLREGNLTFDVGWVGAVSADFEVNDGRWHHVALTGGGTPPCGNPKPLEFYVDGRAVGSGTLRVAEDETDLEPGAMGPDRPEHVMKIGYCTPNFPEGGSCFKGDIDEVRIYNRRLSSADVKAIHENAREITNGLTGRWEFEAGAKDSSGNANHGNIHDAVAVDGKIGRALRFNGKSSYILLPKSAESAGRNNIWNCIQRDFADDAATKEMRWEQQDRIWSNDWQVGDLKELGRRYADACKEIGNLAEKAAKLAVKANTFADLKKVIAIYHTSRAADEISAQLRKKMSLLRQEVEYLDDKYSHDDVKWRSYKRRVQALTKRCDDLILKLAQSDTTAEDKLAGISEDLDKLHEQIPLTLPSGPAGPGRFGAYYARLKYSLEWDKPWRVANHPDVVVQFDDGGHKFVFWRGTSYIPCWVSDAGVWYTNEFVERRGHHSPNTEGCVEPMSDKQCRFSRVRIIESNDARVVVHWRYAPVDVRYNHPFIDPLTGWGDWVDEYYTIYPDAVGVRKITVYTTRPDLWTEFQESIVVNQPGTMPDDNIELGAVSLANMQGQSKTYYWTSRGGPEFDAGPARANIVKINVKGSKKPFALVAPPQEQGLLITCYEGHGRGSHFNFWDHWPVSQAASDGRMATSGDHPSHSSLCHIGLTGMATATWKSYAEGDNWRTKIMLHGMTDKAAGELAPLAKSWLQPPDLQVKTNRLGESAFDSQGYDHTQRAYVLICQKAGRPTNLRFKLEASEDRPLVNPAFVIKDWGDAGASLSINGKRVSFRVGHRRRADGIDLVVWIQAESTEPIDLRLLPAED